MKRLLPIQEMSLKHKLTVLLLTPCLAVLLLAGTIVLWFQIRLYRAEFAKDLMAVAEMVGRNSTAAITFNDAKVASEVLHSLEAKKYILGASLMLPDGTEFACYGNHTGHSGENRGPRLVLDPQYILREKDAILVFPIKLDGKRIATLEIVGDYHRVNVGLMKLMGWMSVLVVMFGVGIALVMSNWLQKFISDPILRLARIARRVADEKDYSVRAGAETGVELGILTHTFNEMLARIQEQDHALSSSQKKIEVLINSIEGIVWEWDPATSGFTFVSNQSHRILGYRPEEWTSDVEFWKKHLHPEDHDRAVKQCEDNSIVNRPYVHEYRMVSADGRTVWIREIGTMITEQGVPVISRGIFEDVTKEKAAAAEVERLNRSLVETSRMAGMAEVATGVLHNVGNVLNSVSVSAALVSDRLKQSKLTRLRQATQLMDTNGLELAQFLTADPRGKVLPQYIRAASDQLVAEQADMMKELSLLNHNIEHIKEIVAMQQNYAKVSGVFEHLDAVALAEDAIRMNLGAFERHQIELVRDYTPELPKVKVDRHKVLQILVNLLRNAKHALDDATTVPRRITVRIAAQDGQVSISVRDNGVGIAPDHLTLIFQHGFTTKRDGHGFGLHSGANAAREMGGSLVAYSDGLGLGAEFTLQLRCDEAVGAWTL